MKSYLPKGILPTIFTLSVFSVLLLIVPHHVYGDGFTMENLPPASVGNKKIQVFIQLTPPVIISDTNQDKTIFLRIFDANTNETVQKYSLWIEITKDNQLLMRDLFSTNTGTITLKITPTDTIGHWTIQADQDPQLLSWMSQGGGPINVLAPILKEGGLYHIHLELQTINFLNNLFTSDTAPKFDSYLSVGDISNHTITYNNNNYNSEIISYYDKINNDFNFDPSKLQVSFSMPFDWNVTRFQDRPIFVHEEVHIPKSFKEFTSTPTYVASVNGDPITGRRLIVDPYSLGDTVIAHILLNKIDIDNLAKTMPPGTNTMDFQLAPAAANVQTSSSVLTDFGGWGINLGWSTMQITANTQNNLKLTFFDAFTEKQVTGDVNYDIKILDNDGNTVLSETGLKAKGGIDTQSINLPSNGIYRIEINIKSIINNGIPDTSRIGIGRGDLVIPSTVKVPEFGPIASLVLVIAIVSVVAVTAKTRLR
ncbi:MAG: PEFG-CTERM sorting domain-containing protein [Thaumarchaeota archaeon]|nr:PEFG-CTERM sorting domain-containing protein [Nitrososphaerota archaeon]